MPPQGQGIQRMLLLQGPACNADFQSILAAPIARIGAPIRRHLQSMQLGFLQRSGFGRADNLPCTATGGGGGTGDNSPPGGSGGGGDGDGEGDEDDELLSKKQVCTSFTEDSSSTLWLASPLPLMLICRAPKVILLP